MTDEKMAKLFGEADTTLGWFRIDPRELRELIREIHRLREELKEADKREQRLKYVEASREEIKKQRDHWHRKTDLKIKEILHMQKEVQYSQQALKETEIQRDNAIQCMDSAEARAEIAERGRLAATEETARAEGRILHMEQRVKELDEELQRCVNYEVEYECKELSNLTQEVETWMQRSKEAEHILTVVYDELVEALDEIRSGDAAIKRLEGERDAARDQVKDRQEYIMALAKGYDDLRAKLGHNEEA